MVWALKPEFTGNRSPITIGVRPALLHAFLKPEHPVRKLLVNLFRRVRIIRIRMVTIVELHDIEPAAVDIKVDIAPLKVWRDRLPNLHLGVHVLDCHKASFEIQLIVSLWGYSKCLWKLLLFFRFCTAS